ncbi:hypothetical protein [Cupriavidus sp. CuC1]|uniref:hypothetical protein n=1 Tax=Cupriavidus TaxID=106589 RepID=UPI00296B0B6A|nr:hypothetical protein [Cupriavidus sp. CV2]MDW3682202.1 hypothetical protein [Cupriavidus sp. CV2]
MKKWIVMLTLAMFGAGAYAQASAPAAPAAGDKPAASSSGKMTKKPAKKKKNHAPPDADKMMNKGA